MEVDIGWKWIRVFGARDGSLRSRGNVAEVWWADFRLMTVRVRK